MDFATGSSTSSVPMRPPRLLLSKAMDATTVAREVPRLPKQKKRPTPLANDQNQVVADGEPQTFSMSTPRGSDGPSRHYMGTPRASAIMSAFLDFGDCDADEEGPPLDFDVAMAALEAKVAEPEAEVEGKSVQQDGLERSQSGSTGCSQMSQHSEEASDESDSDDEDDRSEHYESDFETDTESSDEEDSDAEEDTKEAPAVSVDDATWIESSQRRNPSLGARARSSSRAGGGRASSRCRQPRDRSQSRCGGPRPPRAPSTGKVQRLRSLERVISDILQ